MQKLILTFSLLLIATALFALNPKRTYDITPADFGMDYKEISIKSTDSTVLNAWHFIPRKDGKSQKMIILSPSGDGNMEDLIEQAGQFVTLGYQVITYDYRGYGKSTDFKISSKFYIYSQFAQDLEAVLDWSQKYDVKLAKDLYGVGIGAGLSVSLGASKNYVNRVIADGTYATLETVSKRLEEKGEKMMMPIGYDKTTLEPRFALESKGKYLDKVLLIVADKDPICKAEDAKALAKLNNKITIFMIKGADNKLNFSAHKDDYFKEIKKFLEL